MSTLRLPYPPKELNPNKKLHGLWAWMIFYLTLESGIKVGAGRVKMLIEFILLRLKPRHSWRGYKRELR